MLVRISKLGIILGKKTISKFDSTINFFDIISVIYDFWNLE